MMIEGMRSQNLTLSIDKYWIFFIIKYLSPDDPKYYSNKIKVQAVKTNVNGKLTGNNHK